MTIQRNPLDRDGITRKGQRWRLNPLVIPDKKVVYWDLRGVTGAVKTSTKPN